MVRRTLCLCEGKYIGIETIYTVIDGKQINIPDKLKELRIKSRNNQLFCPCECGSNLILVAGDTNLKKQHFRLKHGEHNQDCHAVMEGMHSIDAKIVLKCWLDDKLCDSNIKSRVSIHDIEDVNRKYEFTFLSLEKKIAISYCHDRANLSDEKLDILESNSHDINIIYIVDTFAAGTGEQYPEKMMKIQSRQGYCLYLEIEGVDYFKAKLKATVYLQNIKGCWEEILLAYGAVNDFGIDDNGKLFYRDDKVLDLLERVKVDFTRQIEIEKEKQDEEERKRLEKYLKQIQIKGESEYQREEEIQDIYNLDFSQQESWICDKYGNRLIQCEVCGKIAHDSAFCRYGGRGRVNLGTCYHCYRIKE